MYFWPRDMGVNPAPKRTCPRSPVSLSVVNPLNPPGFLLYSTYFGGSQGDVAYDVAPDGAGNIVLTGYTLSDDLFTVNAPQPGWGGGINVFVAKIKPLWMAMKPPGMAKALMMGSFSTK